jgi:hypothetical protein
MKIPHSYSFDIIFFLKFQNFYYIKIFVLIITVIKYDITGEIIFLNFLNNIYLKKRCVCSKLFLFKKNIFIYFLNFLNFLNFLTFLKVNLFN